MSPFLQGLIVGLLVMFVLAGIGGMVAKRWLLALQRRTREAERLAELGTLTGGLAHEIKNPLSTVQLNLQLLGEDLPTEPQYARLASRLKTVQQETSRMREILEDFLRYAGRLELDRKPTDLNVLLEELVDFFAPQAQLQKIQLRLRAAPSPVMASVDNRLIKQTILNLMINATQAMPSGGDLMLSVEPSGKDALIDVIDTGTGMTPETVEKVFNAYYSTKKGGMGLGLAMARRIVREHGGELSVTSEQGKGSDFRLRLPLA